MTNGIVRIDRERLWASRGVAVVWERMAKTAMVSFDARTQDVPATTPGDLKLPYMRAMSGAGHDAQEVAGICPIAKVLVAGKHGGISHTSR